MEDYGPDPALVNQAPAGFGLGQWPALHQCGVCGFLSTRRDQFTRRQGVMVDLSCDEAIERGDERETEWFNQRLIANTPAHK